MYGGGKIKCSAEIVGMQGDVERVRQYLNYGIELQKICESRFSVYNVERIKLDRS